MECMIVVAAFAMAAVVQAQQNNQPGTKWNDDQLRQMSTSPALAASSRRNHGPMGRVSQSA